MSHNRQNAKERRLRDDIQRERMRAGNYLIAIGAVTSFVADDGVAATYQTLGQYRTALLKLLQAVGDA